MVRRIFLIADIVYRFVERELWNNFGRREFRKLSDDFAPIVYCLISDRWKERELLRTVANSGILKA